MIGIRYYYIHGKTVEKPCIFLNIEFWVKREKDIVQNSNSTNSIELPRCGPLDESLETSARICRFGLGLNRSFPNNPVIRQVRYYVPCKTLCNV